MKYRSILSAMSLILATVLAGCVSNPGIVKTSDGSYILTRTDQGGSLSDVGATRTDMKREANDFATRQGKVAVPISMKETPMSVQGFTALEYRFQIMDKSDAAAEAKRSDPAPARAAGSPADVKPQERQEHQRDIYNELIKLDDLRKRGILTDAEFDSEKKKILNGN